MGWSMEPPLAAASLLGEVVGRSVDLEGLQALPFTSCVMVLKFPHLQNGVIVGCRRVPVLNRLICLKC